VAVHAFMDESGRDRKYLLCVAIVDPGELWAMRKKLTCLLLPGQRELHFKQEKETRRRALADRLAKLPVEVRIYYSPYTPTTTEVARQVCLGRAVNELLDMDAHRLVIDSREEQDKNDRVTIHQLLSKHAARWNFTYEHIDSSREPLCWIADAAGWCYGAGGHWRQRIMPIIGDVTLL
jgi:hypothetical protein